MIRVKILKAIDGWWHEQCIGDVINVEERGGQFDENAQAVTKNSIHKYNVYRVSAGEYKGYIIPRTDVGDPSAKVKEKRSIGTEKTADDLNKKSREKRTVKKKKAVKKKRIIKKKKDK